MPLVERIVQLQHDIHHDPSIGGKEELGHEAGMRL